ncbi:MAG: preprotein translocase subunit YajC [Candidatus Bipolaricaulota bacterium]
MGGDANIISLVILLAVFGGIFYFLLIRPQRKKQRQHEDLISDLQKGDRVISAGGIHGSIAKVLDDTFVLEVEDGVKLQIEKDSVVEKEEGEAEEIDGGSA